jgi:ATPase family associated with various cellular activities (AAA)
MAVGSVRSRGFTPGEMSERVRDPAEEREEIYRHIEEGSPDRPFPSINEGLARVPTELARGGRLRAKKAKSCDDCEGDLWIERGDGKLVPCACRARRAVKRAHNRLRAGDWWRGTSLSFAAPPLALTPPEIQAAVEGLCGDIKAENDATGIWLVGAPGTGKSALCAYIAQRLYPSGDAIAEQVGDLLGHLRWLGAVEGEVAVERRLQKLIEIPLLVLDNVDRAIRSRPSATPFALQASCLSHDLIRFSRLLQERHAAMKPTVMTSRAEPSDCHVRLASVMRTDLVRGLLGIAIGASDPFEDFPDYTMSVLREAMENVRWSGELHCLAAPQGLAQAA